MPFLFIEIDDTNQVIFYLLRRYFQEVTALYYVYYYHFSLFNFYCNILNFWMGMLFVFFHLFDFYYYFYFIKTIS